MDQKISIKIAGRMFNLTATSPEAEELYRNAADIINQRYADYTRKHPGKNVSDLLSMIALNETVLRLQQKRKSTDSRKTRSFWQGTWNAIYRISGQNKPSTIDS